MSLTEAFNGTAAMILGVTFFIAALSKIVDLPKFRTALSRFLGGKSDESSPMMRFMAATIPGLEFALAFAVVGLVSYRWLVAIIGIGLLATFSIAILLAVRRHDSVECSCLGLTAATRSEPVSWRHIARNIALVALWIPAATVSPATILQVHGLAGLAMVSLAGLCGAALLMELPTVMRVAFAPVPEADEPRLAL